MGVGTALAWYHSRPPCNCLCTPWPFPRPGPGRRDGRAQRFTRCQHPEPCAAGRGPHAVGAAAAFRASTAWQAAPLPRPSSASARLSTLPPAAQSHTQNDNNESSAPCPCRFVEYLSSTSFSSTSFSYAPLHIPPLHIPPPPGLSSTCPPLRPPPALTLPPCTSPSRTATAKPSRRTTRRSEVPASAAPLIRRWRRHVWYCRAAMQRHPGGYMQPRRPPLQSAWRRLPNQ